MSEIASRPGWYDELAVQHALAGPAFYELVACTSEACLVSPRRVDRHVAELAVSHQPSSGDRLISRLGLWGIRSALEMKSDPDAFTLFGEDHPDYVDAGFAMRAPTYFSGELDPRIQRMFEALGRSVLDEALLCLGDGVIEKVDEYQAATTLTQKREVIDWLLNRVERIRLKTRNRAGDATQDQDTNSDGTEDGAESREDYFYHPARLSPQFIGQYPDINLEPTCLGVSILIASFFEKAQAPYLHAGVAESLKQNVRRELMGTLTKIKKIAARWDIIIPDDFAMAISDAMGTNEKVLAMDDGYHAAILVKLDDDAWMQLDPNLGGNISIRQRGDVEELNGVFDDLKRIGHGVELMFDNPGIGLNTLLEYLMEGYADISPSVGEIDAYLRDNTGITIQDLADRFLKPVLFFDGDKTVAEVQEVVRRFLKYFVLEDSDGTDASDPYVDDKFARVINYAFPDADSSSLAACLERCRRDPWYRQRRAEDLKLAPLVFVYSVVTDLANAVIEGRIVDQHKRMEFGLPAYRIGACVLSDFAVYCGDDLPPSFWLTYWPSHVAVTEHIHRAGSPTSSRVVGSNVLSLLGTTSLRYVKSHAIVGRYLEQERKAREEGSC